MDRQRLSTILNFVVDNRFSFVYTKDALLRAERLVLPMSNTKNSSLTKMVFTSLFAALLAVLSQLSIPMPSGVPITLQTFAVALTGYMLGWKMGTLSTVIYLLLGAVGLPVFANFKGGFGSLVGYTGGFLWGFILFTFFCGLSHHFKHKFPALLLGAAGLLCCHFLGVFQYHLVAGVDLKASFLLVSAPYLIKDGVSVFAAYFFSLLLRKRIVNILPAMLY